MDENLRKKEYEFDIDEFDNGPAYVKRKGDEPDFKINTKLRKAVLKKMPKDIPVEMKAMYIYDKLCYVLQYDEGYMYRDRFPEKYVSDFSKESLENIKPGSKVVCWDFARIYAKLLNELGDGMNAVTIQLGNSNKAHWLAGFYTPNLSVSLDAVQLKQGLNDLARIKAGVIPCNTDVIENGMNYQNIANEAYGIFMKEKKIPTLQECMYCYKKMIPRKNEHKYQDSVDEENAFKQQLLSFIEEMKKLNIKGNEAFSIMLRFDDAGFFSGDFKGVLVGKKVEKQYERNVLIQRKKLSGRIYMVDLSNYNCTLYDRQSIDEMLQSGQIEYENKRYTLYSEEELGR